MIDLELQRTCTHVKAVEQSRSQTTEPATNANGDRYHKPLTLIHLYCPKCGMMFAREVRQ